MSSNTLGPPTSGVEVTNIGPHGIWLLVESGEYFLPFETFPWFKKASIEQIVDVQLHHSHHLHWPQLDVDLSLDIIVRPGDFPLVSHPRST